jgi:hypothetical protein
MNTPNPDFNDFLSDAIAGANQLNIDRLASNPEWTDKEYYHIQTLIQAFAHGIISSYPYYKGYTLPPNFEKVMAYMADAIEKEFNYEIVPQVGLLKMKGVYKRLAMACPEYVEWNTIGNPDPNGIYGVSAYDGVRTKPDFIDLDVPPHNAVLFLRSHTRENKAFDKEFKENYGDLK